MKHFKVTFRPDGEQISIHSGATVLEAAGQAGIILNSVCGGRGICGKCAVIVEGDGGQRVEAGGEGVGGTRSGGIETGSQAEAGQDEGGEDSCRRGSEDADTGGGGESVGRGGGERVCAGGGEGAGSAGEEVLACQYHIESDLVVTIPVGARFFEQQILAVGIDVQGKIEPGGAAGTKEKAGTAGVAGLGGAAGTKEGAGTAGVAGLGGAAGTEEGAGAGERVGAGEQESRESGHYLSMAPSAGGSGTEERVGAGEVVERGEEVGAGEVVERGERVGAGEVVERGEEVGAGEVVERGEEVGAGEMVERGEEVATGRGVSAGEVFGLAVDIGTTTVVAKLIDMTTGRVAATQADINPQVRYGDDCVSRISYGGSEEKLGELHRVIIDFINELVAKLCRRAGIDSERVGQACIVGNTTMNHIFLKLPVGCLGQAPYKAYSLEAQDVPAKKLGLQINPAANIHTVENIAGFVGSDITAVAVATGIAQAEEMTLIVDIGTNGEIVLGTKDRLYAASCAAGPAFEGARISCGSRAVEGAIEAAVFDGTDIDFDVIGGGPARSICGSGLIDAVALLVELGIIESSGRFLEPEGLRDSVFEAVVSRVIEQKGQAAFVLAADEETGRRVVLTQEDIRQCQLAKAAIRAGIKLLQRKIGVRDDDIEQVLLAGAFGNYIRAESALRIGLLPAVGVERIRFVGNAAASGAQMILISRKAQALAGRLAGKIEYVEIANERDFADVFAGEMSF